MFVPSSDAPCGGAGFTSSSRSEPTRKGQQRDEHYTEDDEKDLGAAHGDHGVSLRICRLDPVREEAAVRSKAMIQTATPFLLGLILGLALIIPIGVQSLFVLNQGLLAGFPRALVGVVAVCFCDTFLIVLGAAGASALLALLGYQELLITVDRKSTRLNSSHAN